MMINDDTELRVIALEHAVKAVPGYKTNFNGMGGTENPGTPAPEVVVQRAQAYYDFLTTAKPEAGQ